MVIPFNEKKYSLVHQIAHKAKLTPEEYSLFYAELKINNIEIFDVEIPDWPPVPYAPLHFGSGNIFEGMNWVGIQPAINVFDLNRAIKISQVLAGDEYSGKRVSYWWGVPIYNPEKHILLRQWLTEHEVSIVDFFNKFVPKLGTDPIVEVTNPHIRKEKENGGSYSPTKRAIPRELLDVLKQFEDTAEKFSYGLNQDVSWIRSLDDTRWEARRQYAPQNKTWMNHKSYIMRPIGSGAWSDVDRDPVEGYPFGPFMELWDDGTVNVWVMKRTLSQLENRALVINGIDVQLTPKDGVHVIRMEGNIPVDKIPSIINGKIIQSSLNVLKDSDDINDNTKTVQTNLEESSGKNVEIISKEMPSINVEFEDRGSWMRAIVDNSDVFYRPNHRAEIVIKKLPINGELRIWGDSIISNGIILNGVSINQDVNKLYSWNGGWRSYITEDQKNKILNIDVEENQNVEKTKPQQKEEIKD